MFVICNSLIHSDTVLQLRLVLCFFLSKTLELLKLICNKVMTLHSLYFVILTLFQLSYMEEQSINLSLIESMFGPKNILGSGNPRHRQLPRQQDHERSVYLGFNKNFPISENEVRDFFSKGIYIYLISLCQTKCSLNFY